MADEEKEKAEKLAAAKKRFEQLKKEQQKKAKKGGKKKEDKTADGKAEVETAAEDAPNEAAEGTVEAEQTVEDAQPDEDTAQPSLTQQSKQRSESFKQSWSARIEELEQENKALKSRADESATSLAKVEEELESLREGSSDIAELRTKAKDHQRLSDELTSTQRQLTQAQQAAKGQSRRVSGTAAAPDFNAQLDEKISTIETLQLQLGNLRNQITTLESTLSDRDASAADLLTRAETAESATATLQTELDALKVSLAFPAPSDSTTSTPDPDQLAKKISVLESDLRTATSNLTLAATRAQSLEQKIEALTRLHGAATAAAAAKDRELDDLRAAARRRDRGSHVRDASDFELEGGDDDEGAAAALQARIRALEAEVFDLRRGVWRDRRAELQPGMHDDVGGGEDGDADRAYEDVDLTPGLYGAFGALSAGLGGGSGGAKNGGPQRQHSTFQDVITSGISAFTGRPRDAPGAVPAGRERKASLGLLSEDGFDEDAYRLAQEEEAKRRIERVKEIKRGLDQWRGWRMDIADIRRGGLVGGREAGPVFEV